MTTASAVGRARTPGVPQWIVLWLAALPIVAVVGTIIGVASGVRGTKLTMLALALVTLCLGLVPIIVNQARPAAERGIIFSMLSIWFTLFFVVPVFTNYIQAPGVAIPGSMSGNPIALPDIVRGQWAALLGLCALLLGNYLPIGRSLARALRPARRDWSHGVMLVTAVVMLVLGWTLYISGSLGLIPERLGTGIIGTLGSGVIYANVLLTIAVWRYRSRMAILLLAIAVPVSSFVGFFGGSKEGFLQAPAIVGLTVMTLRGRIAPHWIIAGLIVLILTFPTVMFIRTAVVLDGKISVVTAIRDFGGTMSRVQSFTSGTHLSEHLQTGFQAAGNRLDDLGVTSVLIRDTPRVSPFQNGRTLALFFIAFVPRVIWPEKPFTSTGRWINQTYTPSVELETWIASSAVGDFYINFGYTGVFAGMLLFGLILRFADEALLSRQRTAPMILAAIVVLYKMGLGIEHNIGASWSTAIFALIPIAATHMIFRMLGLTIPIQNTPAAGTARRAGAAS